jgi:hypothetical protein
MTTSNKLNRPFEEVGIGLLEEYTWIHNSVTDKVILTLCRHILHRVKEAYGLQNIPEQFFQEELPNAILEHPVRCCNQAPVDIHKKYKLAIKKPGKYNLENQLELSLFILEEVSKSICKFKYLLRRESDPTIELCEKYEDFPNQTCFLKVYTFSNRLLMNSILYGAYWEMKEESELNYVMRGIVEIKDYFIHEMHILLEGTYRRREYNKNYHTNKKFIELMIGYDHTENQFNHRIAFLEKTKVVKFPIV